MFHFVRAIIGIVAIFASVTCFGAARGYLLGPGDSVKISVYQNPDMTIETRVSEVGSVTFPLLGPVEIGGLTPAQAEIRIAALLKSGGFVPRAQVTVLVTLFRSRQVSVLGQVNHPGRYAIEEPTVRLTDVLAIAGGIATTGAETVTVIRGGEGSEQRMEVDLLGLFDGSNQAKNIELGNGDTVFVPRIPVYYIYGEVQRPGAYRLEKKMTVMQAVSLASGLTPRGSEKGLRIERRGTTGGVKSMNASMQDIVVQDDVIYIKESLF
ncbi:MAG TPA: polysaccharide export protein EpsE [Burkholderiales bacterium]|nr:polysaccharide export protein EpsE [Burkholderiales bacterium]